MLSSFYRLILTLTRSFFGHGQYTNEPIESNSPFYCSTFASFLKMVSAVTVVPIVSPFAPFPPACPIVVLSISGISFRLVKFPALFMLPIYSFKSSAFSTRTLGMLALVTLSSLSDNSNVCIVSESDADLVSSDCFSCLLAFKFLLKSGHVVLSNSN